HRDTRIEVVGAGREDVLSRRRRLRRDRRRIRRIEEHRPEAGQQIVSRFARPERKLSAVGLGLRNRRTKGRRLEFEQKLSGGQIVVRSAVDPEESRVARDLFERLWWNTGGMANDGFDDLAHLETAGRLLVVEDVATGDGGLHEVPDQLLL